MSWPGGGGVADVSIVSPRSNTRSLDPGSTWWTSTPIVFTPATRSGRCAVQSYARYAFPVSWPSARVDPLLGPDGMKSEPMRVPFRKTTIPSSYITSPSSRVTCAGSVTVNCARKYVVMCLFVALGP